MDFQGMQLLLVVSCVVSCVSIAMCVFVVSILVGNDSELREHNGEMRRLRIAESLILSLSSRDHESVEIRRRNYLGDEETYLVTWCVNRNDHDQRCVYGDGKTLEEALLITWAQRCHIVQDDFGDVAERVFGEM